MSKEDSKIMQGVAILLMLFFHLFNYNGATEYQGTILGRLAMSNNPVPFYVFLSGYGLYCVNFKGYDRNMYRRIGKVLLHYWIITATFTFISVFLLHKDFNLNLLLLIENILGTDTSIYPPAWFVLPYIMLSILSPILFRCIERYNKIVVIVTSFGLYLLAAYMNRYTFFRANIFQVLYIQFSFVLGMIFAKYKIIQRIKTNPNFTPPYTAIILLVLLITIRFFISSGLFSSLYAAAFISIFSIIRKQKWINTIFIHLGKASLSMWMIHAWICWYLFKDEIYNINHPLLMFLTLICICYILALIFDFVIKQLNSIIYNNR